MEVTTACIFSMIFHASSDLPEKQSGETYKVYFIANAAHMSRHYTQSIGPSVQLRSKPEGWDLTSAGEYREGEWKFVPEGRTGSIACSQLWRNWHRQTRSQTELPRRQLRTGPTGPSDGPPIPIIPMPTPELGSKYATDHQEWVGGSNKS